MITSTGVAPTAPSAESDMSPNSRSARRGRSGQDRNCRCRKAPSPAGTPEQASNQESAKLVGDRSPQQGDAEQPAGQRAHRGQLDGFALRVDKQKNGPAIIGKARRLAPKPSRSRSATRRSRMGRGHGADPWRGGGLWRDFVASVGIYSRDQKLLLKQAGQPAL
jgi:hypothetical protein